jgi:hypothetical protein
VTLTNPDTVRAFLEALHEGRRHPVGVNAAVVIARRARKAAEARK